MLSEAACFRSHSPLIAEPSVPGEKEDELERLEGTGKGWGEKMVFACVILRGQEDTQAGRPTGPGRGTGSSGGRAQTGALGVGGEAHRWECEPEDRQAQKQEQGPGRRTTCPLPTGGGAGMVPRG